MSVVTRHIVFNKTFLCIIIIE